MTKRIFGTYLLFLCINFIVFILVSKIGMYKPLTMMDIIILATIYATLYLLCVFVATRKYPKITWLVILGLLIIVLAVVTQVKEVVEPILNREIILGAIIMVVQSSVATIQVEIYKKERKNNEIEFEEISPDGKKIRDGKIKK